MTPYATVEVLDHFTRSGELTGKRVARLNAAAVDFLGAPKRVDVVAYAGPHRGVVQVAIRSGDGVSLSAAGIVSIEKAITTVGIESDRVSLVLVAPNEVLFWTFCPHEEHAADRVGRRSRVALYLDGAHRAITQN